MDSVERYAILMRVGADFDMRKKALFIQVLLNFSVPLMLGILHSVFALRYVKGLLLAVGMRRMFGGTVAAAIIMLLKERNWNISLRQMDMRCVISV